MLCKCLWDSRLKTHVWFSRSNEAVIRDTQPLIKKFEGFTVCICYCLRFYSMLFRHRGDFLTMLIRARLAAEDNRGESMPRSPESSTYQKKGISSIDAMISGHNITYYRLVCMPLEDNVNARIKQFQLCNSVHLDAASHWRS